MRRLPRHQQPFDNATANNMLSDNLWHIVERDAAIPNLLGIHHHRDALVALVEATGGIGSDLRPHARRTHLLFKGVAHGLRTAMLAATARIVRWSLVGADKHVARIVRRHARSLADLLKFREEGVDFFPLGIKMRRDARADAGPMVGKKAPAPKLATRIGSPYKIKHHRATAP